MVLPELMFKIWDGDANERFTFRDMNRVEYNANMIAGELGLSEVEFMENTHRGQFRYDEANALEARIKEEGV